MRTHRKLGEIEAHTLIILLIATLSIIILFVMLLRVKDIASDGSEKNCAALARDMHLTNTIAGRDFVDSTIEGCETEFVTVKRDDLPNDDTAAQERMKHLLAEEMRQCWNDWGKGELELFKEEGVYCHVCAKVHFDHAERQALPLRNFSGYLAEEKAPEGDTYAQVLTGAISENTGVEMKHFGEQVYTVDTSRDQLVLFTYAKYKDQKTLAQVVFGADKVTPGASALIAGGTVATGAIILGAPVVVPAGVAFFVVGAITSAADDFYTFSAIYITPEDPSSYNAESCERLAAVTQSP